MSRNPPEIHYRSHFLHYVGTGDVKRTLPLGVPRILEKFTCGYRLLALSSLNPSLIKSTHLTQIITLEGARELLLTTSSAVMYDCPSGALQFHNLNGALARIVT